MGSEMCIRDRASIPMDKNSFEYFCAKDNETINKRKHKEQIFFIITTLVIRNEIRINLRNFNKFIQITKVVDTFKVQVQESSSSSTRDVDPKRLPALHFGLELGTCA